jgi:hypothetical protein
MRLFELKDPAFDGEPIIYRAPIDVKCMVKAGPWSQARWSTKTIAGLEVIVRPQTVSILFSWPVLQPFLRSKWIFDTSEARCEVSGEPSPRWFKRRWIVLRSDRPSRRGDVAIKRWDGLEQIWEALMVAGVTPTSDPP